ncbi:hypothetical protein C0995_013956 [Termitomyces sp. Mi166|nr:hypothetical protein C0995_013956 [Termitomyces sp. Mi166\
MAEPSKNVTGYLPSLINDFQLVIRLHRVLNNSQMYRQLLRYKGLNAQALLDFFQSLLDIPELDRRFRCYELKGVQLSETGPVTAGGFADIYKGGFEGQVVCLKVIRVYQDSQLDHVLKQFSKEVILWGQLSHAHVLPMYGLYRLKGRLCFVAPWMENGDITVYLQKNPKADRPFLSADVAEGLSYLHKNNIVHGDLKGPNVLIDATGRARLSDFGISNVSDANIMVWTSQSSSSRGGSVRWQGPELVNIENEEIPENTLMSDVYALGCVFYEIFTGNVPFHTVSRDFTVILHLQRGDRPARPTEWDSAWREWGLTENIWTLIEDCWKENPVERLTAEQVLQRLASSRWQQSEKLELGPFLSPVHFRRRMSEPLDETPKLALEKLLHDIIKSIVMQGESLTHIDERATAVTSRDNYIERIPLPCQSPALHLPDIGKGECEPERMVHENARINPAGSRGEEHKEDAIGFGSSRLVGSSSYKFRKKGFKRDDEKRGRSIVGHSLTRRRYGSLSLSRERGDAFSASDSASGMNMFSMQAREELPSDEKRGRSILGHSRRKHRGRVHGRSV